MNKYRNQYQERDYQHTLLMVLLSFIFILFLGWLYKSHIIYYSCVGLYSLYDFIPSSLFRNVIIAKMNLLAFAANHAVSLSYGQFLNVLNQTAIILLIPLALIALAIFKVASNHPEQKLSRKLNVFTLPKTLSKVSPAIIPSLCYGNENLLLNTNPKEHRSARSPEEFVIEHQLTVNNKLDRKRTEELLKKQLGKPLDKLNEMHELYQALCVIFALAFLFDKRKLSESLLNSLNRSCLNKERKGYPNLKIASKYADRVLNHKKFIEFAKGHYSARTLITALYDNDLQLPTSRFRWLKGMDRTLWYSLNSCGRPSCFIEGLGVMTQKDWENLFKEKDIQEPKIILDLAIDGLENYLLKIKLIKRLTQKAEKQFTKNPSSKAMLHP